MLLEMPHNGLLAIEIHLPEHLKHLPQDRIDMGLKVAGVVNGIAIGGIDERS